MTQNTQEKETLHTSELLGDIDVFMALTLEARVARLTAMTDAERNTAFKAINEFLCRGIDRRSEFWIEADQVDLFTASGDVVRAHVRYVKTDTEFGYLTGLIALRGMIAIVTGRPF